MDVKSNTYQKAFIFARMISFYLIFVFYLSFFWHRENGNWMDDDSINLFSSILATFFPRALYSKKTITIFLSFVYFLWFSSTIYSLSRIFGYNCISDIDCDMQYVLIAAKLFISILSLLFLYEIILFSRNKIQN